MSIKSVKKINYLDEISGFSSLVKYYNEHKNSNWREWLEFEQTLMDLQRFKIWTNHNISW